MTAPRRVQRKRSAGWRNPAGTVYVGRPTKYGNPFRLDDVVKFHTKTGGPGPELVQKRDVRDARMREATGAAGFVLVTLRTFAEVVDTYRVWLSRQPELLEQARAELRGHDLSCWCSPDHECHVDVLLVEANRPDPTPTESES